MPEKRKYIDLDKWDPRVERKIVVAVDFGTTFSGIAFAQTAKPDIRTPITQWPDSSSSGDSDALSSEKVQSWIFYDNTDTPLWGSQIARDGDRYQCFKLALEDPGRFTKAFGAGLLDQKAKRIPQHLSAEKLTTDYLKCLRQHTLNHLGNRLAKAVLHTTPIEWCLTMPAIWSDAAKARTRECAKQAFGPTSLHFLNEPEAAILYAMSTIDPKYTKVGNTYIICDCGGETVDLISYQITRVEPKIEVAETVPGSGGLCGSNFLNRRFQRLLKQKLANAPGNEENGAYAIDEALDRFEVLVKKSYRDTSESFKFPVNGLGDAKDIGIKRGMLVIHASELAQVFNPVIDEIVELVRAQISKNVTVNGVLLVGGFGQNGLLRERIRDAIAHEIEVIQPPDAWTAVVRGALLRGLAEVSSNPSTVSVASRSARKFYGTSTIQDFVKGRHDISRRYFWNFSGRHQFNGTSWFVEKGAKVTEALPISFDFHQRLKVSEGIPQYLTCGVLVFEDPNDTGATIYEDETQVLARLCAAIGHVPVSEYEEVIGYDKARYYQILYKIWVTFYSARTDYALEINGKRYDTVTAEYV